VEQECKVVGEAGYLGVKLFPHQEQLMSTEPFQNMLNPWYFMYQPVSYRLQGRMGTRDDLRKLIQTCRGHGVRVYADAVINHMTGGGNDANPHHHTSSGSNCVTWGAKNSSAYDPSPFYTQSFTYTYNDNTDQPAAQENPAVPYGPTDFHCERPLNSWDDPLELNAGWLTGLGDLNTEHKDVQQRIADYLTDLLGIGISGIRIDAAKHIKPDDLVAIFNALRTNMGGTLPDDFVSWLEVLLGGEASMLIADEDSGYNFGPYLTKALLAAGLSQTDVDKIKIWYSAYPSEPGIDQGHVSMVRKAIQNDDADQQNQGSSSRDMHDKGSVLVKDRDPAKHRSFEEILFNNPYGSSDNKNDYPIRMVLSSYYFDSAVDNNHAIPDGKSDCKLCTMNCDSCESVPLAKAYQADAKSYDGPVYTRVHRDADIIAAMRSWMELD
jgi:alpha-amylase